MTQSLLEKVRTLETIFRETFHTTAILTHRMQTKQQSLILPQVMTLEADQVPLEVLHRHFM